MSEPSEMSETIELRESDIRSLLAAAGELHAPVASEMSMRDVVELLSRVVRADLTGWSQMDTTKLEAMTCIVRRDDEFEGAPERDQLLLLLLLPHVQRATQRIQATEVGLNLTEREREVMQYVRAGCSNTQIARALGVCPATICKHLEHVYSRIGVHSRTEALAALPD